MRRKLGNHHHITSFPFVGTHLVDGSALRSLLYTYPGDFWQASCLCFIFRVQTRQARQIYRREHVSFQTARREGKWKIKCFIMFTSCYFSCHMHPIPQGRINPSFRHKRGCTLCSLDLSMLYTSRPFLCNMLPISGESGNDHSSHVLFLLSKHCVGEMKRTRNQEKRK